MPTLNLSYRDDVFQVQRRLIELGFLKGFSPDGNWGPKSQQALIEFKKQAGLGGGGDWDGGDWDGGDWDSTTRRVLFSDQAVHAKAPAQSEETTRASCSGLDHLPVYPTLSAAIDRAAQSALREFPNGTADELWKAYKDHLTSALPDPRTLDASTRMAYERALTLFESEKMVACFPALAKLQQQRAAPPAQAPPWAGLQHAH
ncbi:MAG: peptidoglycan-binding domain-containing protein [Methyloceanibacter sp.]|jgi:peptidoglycan hydrolase-like protein with peptidoglycan-binding domain